MKKILTVFCSAVLFSGTLVFADDENYDGQTVSGDFSGKSMNYSSWVGANVNSSNFSNAKLKEAVFSNAKVIECNFSNAILKYADFSNVSFTPSNYSNEVNRGTRFENADLTNVNFSNAQFVGQYGSFVVFDNADITGANFSNAIFAITRQEAHYTQDYAAVLNISKFSSVNFNGAVFVVFTWAGDNGAAVDLSNKEFENVDFSNAILSVKYWSGSNSKSVSFANSTFKNCNFTGATLGADGAAEGVDFSNFNLSDTNFSGAYLNGVSFENTNLSNVNLSNSQVNGYTTLNGADITNANFSNITGLTTTQLSQTLNYKNKDLSGVKFNGLDLTNWILREQNLQNTGFNGATLTGVNMRYADLRGSDLNNIVGSPKTLNTLWNDGVIKNFSMESADDNLTIRKYTPATSGGEMISAKVSESDATVSGGATLKLDTGARLDVVNKKTLTIAENGVLVIDTSISDPTQIYIESLAGLVIDGKLTVNITENLLENVEYRFDLISFEDDSNIASLKDLKPDESLYLTIKGKTFNGYWSCVINENTFSIIATQVPEPATIAAVFGALALGLAVYRRRK